MPYSEPSRLDLQRSEPPKTPPVVDGLQLASQYQPSAATVGAFHDYVDLGSGRLAVFVADVSGPSGAGSIIVRRVRELLRSSATLRDAMVRMNRELSSDALRGAFVTLFVAVIDVPAASVTICSAGHNAMIFLTPRSRETEFLNTRGLAMGIDRGPQFESMVAEQTLPFEPGDRFLLYTDGLRKMANPGGHEYGAERLAERFRDMEDKECAEIMAALHASLSSFRGGMVPLDDFVMIAVRRIPAAQPVEKPAAVRSPLEEHLDTSLMQIQELKRRLRTEQEKIDHERHEGARQIQELRGLLEQALQQATESGRIQQLLDDRNRLEEKVASLQKTVSELQAKAPGRQAELQKRIAQLEAQAIEAEKANAELTRQIEELQSAKTKDELKAAKVRGLQRQIEDLKAKAAEALRLEAELSELKAKASATEAARRDHEGQAAALKNRMEELENQAAEASALRKQLQELKTMREQADAAAAESEERRKRIEDLEARAAALKKQLEESQAVRERVDAAAAESEVRRKRIEELEVQAAEAAALKKQVEELQAMRKRVDTAAAGSEERRKRIEELEAQAAEAEALKKRLEELQAVRERADAAAAESEARRKRIEDLEAQAAEAAVLKKQLEEVQAMRERADGAAAESDERRKRIEELEQSLSREQEQSRSVAAEKEKRLWEEVLQREARIAELQRELERVRQAHAESQASRTGMSEVMARLKESLESEIRSRDEHIRKLQGLLAKQSEESETKIQELTAKLTSLKPLLMRAQDEIKEKTARIERLEKTRTSPKMPAIQTGARPAAPPPPTTRVEARPPKPRFMKTMRAPIPVIKPTSRIDSTNAPSVEPETKASGLVRMHDVLLTISRSRFGLRHTLPVAHLRGVSETTLAATVSEPLEAGTSVRVKLDVKKFGDTIEIEGRVIDQSVLTLNELFEITVLFEKISDHDKRRLSNALSYYSSDAGRAQH